MHFDDRAVDAVFEQTLSLVILSSFGCLSPHSEGATFSELFFFGNEQSRNILDNDSGDSDVDGDGALSFSVHSELIW